MAFHNFLCSCRYLLICDLRLFFFRPLASVHRMAGARGTNSTGRKQGAQSICGTSCVIKKPCSGIGRSCKQKKGDASVLVSARVLLSDSPSPWERHCHAVAFCGQLKTQVRLTDVLSMQGRSLTKLLSVSPELFKSSIHVLRKISTLSALQLAFCP